MKQLMVVDTSDIVRKVARRILTEMGYVVSEASSAAEALGYCEVALPNFMIIDSGLDGALELIGSVRALPEGKDCQIFYCLIEADIKLMMQGKRAGANEFLLKPFDRKILTETFGGDGAIA